MPGIRRPPPGDGHRKPLPGTRQARLLIVDDEEMNVLLLEDMLRQAGYSAIWSTTDSRETLALCRSFAPDLILLDLMMPDMDGMDVMEQLNAEWPEGADVPVLVLTADITPQTKRRALLKGAKDFLTKPFDTVELLLRIANLLETRLLFLDLQRTSEKRLQLALDSGRLGTYHRDLATGEYLDISDTCKIHCGYPPDAELSYGDVVRAQHPDDRDGVEAAMRQAQADCCDFEVEYRVIAPDGGVQWLVSHGMPVCDARGKVIEVFGMTQDITERKRAQEALRASAEKLQALSRRLVEVQEAERREIARELHDQIGQILTGLSLTLDMGKRLTGEPLRQNQAQAEELTRDVIARVRQLSLDLRPAMLDDLGLIPALHWHFGRLATQAGVRVAFTHAGLQRRFPPEVETAAYRIVQESLTNVARHADVREAQVCLWTDQDRLNVRIEDSGAGFDGERVLASYASSGLTGMQERVSLLGGRFAVDSAPGAGTRVVVGLPIRDPPRPEGELL